MTLIPFSTVLLAEHIASRAALIVYWGNILLLGRLLFWTWQCAVKAKLIRDDTPPEVVAVICRRIIFSRR